MRAVEVGRGRPTKDISRQKAAAILTTAREAFCRTGYRAVTMRQIAEEAEVSTRTLYNRYRDKFSLFSACLEFGSSAFPTLDEDPSANVAAELHRFAVGLVRTLSRETSQRLGMLVYREGAEFPELIKASENNQQEHLVRPLAAFLLRHRLAEGDAEQRAKILLSMMLSGWQRRVSFRLPAPSDRELDEHAALVVELFLKGAAIRNTNMPTEPMADMPTTHED
jgi:TetR/AcrR family transcriptional repressor of mexJK operon